MTKWNQLISKQINKELFYIRFKFNSVICNNFWSYIYICIYGTNRNDGIILDPFVVVRSLAGDDDNPVFFFSKYRAKTVSGLLKKILQLRMNVWNSFFRIFYPKTFFTRDNRESAAIRLIIIIIIINTALFILGRRFLLLFFSVYNPQQTTDRSVIIARVLKGNGEKKKKCSVVNFFSPCTGRARPRRRRRSWQLSPCHRGDAIATGGGRRGRKCFSYISSVSYCVCVGERGKKPPTTAIIIDSNLYV